VTTEQTTRVVPAGWYQDPADDAKVRWWNGITWTEHVESKPTGAGAAVAGARAIEAGSTAGATLGITDEQRAAEASALERQYAASDLDMSRRASIALDHRGPDTGTIPIQGVLASRKPARTGTAASWMLAATPLITSVLALVAGYVYFYVTPTPLVFAVVVVLFVLGFLWAVGDGRTLESRGLKAPSPLLALALPVIGPLLYLIARRRVIDGSSPLILFGALLLITVIAPIAIAATGGAQAVSKALEVQVAVRDDLVGSGAATSVSCPPFVEKIEAGSVFTCDAVLPSGDNVHVWVSFDNEQGQFSWALANR
jgi:hypothetical protein